MQVLPTEQCRYKIRGLLTVDMQRFSVATLYPPYKFSYTGTSSPDSDSLIGTHFHDLITAGTQWSVTHKWGISRRQTSNFAIRNNNFSMLNFYLIQQPESGWLALLE